MHDGRIPEGVARRQGGDGGKEEGVMWNRPVECLVVSEHFSEDGLAPL